MSFWRTNEQLMAEIERLDQRNGELYQQIEDAERKLRNVYERTPEIVGEAGKRRADLERLMALAGMGENHPVWRAVLSYADEHARNEQFMALSPGLPDADRQYNAGRAGGALDFAIALRELREKAERESRKQ